jgi:hypothetical protein
MFNLMQSRGINFKNLFNELQFISTFTTAVQLNALISKISGVRGGAVG